MFCQELLDEYILDDCTRVTKKAILEWTEKRRKCFLLSELLREFKKKSNKLLVRDQENVDLFVQITKKLKKDISILLGDHTSTIEIMSNWIEVLEACCIPRRRALRMEDNAKISNNIIVSNHPTQESTTRARGQKGKELDSPIDEIIKSMKDLQLRLTKPEKVENFN